MQRFKNVEHVKDDLWRVRFFENCKLREIRFFCDIDPTRKTLEEILLYPQVGKNKDISYRDALIKMGNLQMPSTFRQQKKMFRRITDNADLEEHF